jgi:hypothetical protein
MVAIKRSLAVSCVLAAAALAGGGRLGANDGIALVATVAHAPERLPLVFEHRYRMMARVRPLLFWIGKDNVGGARISWRGTDDGGFGVDLLVGSDPDRAPGRINKWGYIAEQVHDGDAHVIGVMKQSNEQIVEEAQKLMTAGGEGGFFYNAIQGTATAQHASAAVTTVRVDQDLTFRDIDPLLALVSASRSRSDRPRSVPLPAGTRPGFLVALHDLVTQTADAYRASSGPGTGSSPTVRYVYYGKFYDLSMANSELLNLTTIDGHRYTDVARSNFEIKNQVSGEMTRFQLTYGTRDALYGVPVHAVYQARWWFEAQLFLDDTTKF